METRALQVCQEDYASICLAMVTGDTSASPGMLRWKVEQWWLSFNSPTTLYRFLLVPATSLWKCSVAAELYAGFPLQEKIKIKWEGTRNAKEGQLRVLPVTSAHLLGDLYIVCVKVDPPEVWWFLKYARERVILLDQSHSHIPHRSDGRDYRLTAAIFHPSIRDVCCATNVDVCQLFLTWWTPFF